MNIITWNCAMAFRKKYQHVLEEDLDVLVLQECEHKDKILDLLADYEVNEFIWYGKNVHKGVAVISFGDIQIELMEVHDPKYEYVLPIKLIKKNRTIHLFAIWAMPHPSKRTSSYVGQVWAAINHYKDLLEAPSLLIGDFNSHPIWDHKYPNGCHTDVVNFLADRGIKSLYHHCRGILSGDEEEPTFYLTKKQDKPYHLDYCFASTSLISTSASIAIGKYEKWITLSDHMPVHVQL